MTATNSDSNSNTNTNTNLNSIVPKMSRYITLPTTYSFIILCNQRSGSHLLMSFLDSHPQISCYGEYRYPNDLHHKTIRKPNLNSGILLGCIFMYNHVYEHPQYLNEITWSKCIHLTRDLNDTAVSMLRSYHEDRTLREENKRFKFHRHINEPPIKFQTDYYPNKHEIERCVKQIKSRTKSCLDLIMQYNRPVLNITYEELTNGEDIRMMPEPVKLKLCEFLKVSSEVDLTTYIIKGAK